ncbi:MAG: cysteine hydrolase family protein [Thermomicrobiales bacterium]
MTTPKTTETSTAQDLATTTWANDSALVVIDVQRGVVADGWDRDGVVNRIAGLIDHARDIKVPVIYIQHEDETYAPMARGGDSWQICDEIAPRDGEIVIAKSYPDAFAETDLRATLDDLGIRNLVLCGAQTDACVRATTYRAIADGYGVTLVSDCHTTGDRAFDGVEISGKQIVAHMNASTPYIEYPGRAPKLATQAELVTANRPATV